MVSTIIEMKDGEGYFIAAINKKHLSKNPTKRSVIFRNHFRKQADKIAEMSSLMSFEYGKGNYLLKMSVMKDYDVNTMIYSKGPLASSYYAEDLYVVRYDIITR
ncbi:hypothetical protein BC455_17900 [Vibrio harveyi]|nr:hypothetical protein BC455_17900 [Vibrio harveyi]